MLELQEFIKEHKDWKLLLTKDPYSLKINENEFYYLFKYNQIASDFSIPLVQEARGICIDKKDFSIAKHPFHKFFNLGEDLAADIDWDSALVYDKIDGSLISCYYNKYIDKWVWATNGTINAKSAELPNNYLGLANYYELLQYTFEKMHVTQLNLELMFYKDFTYVFELTTPINKVVIPYSDFTLTHLATISNQSGEEIEQILNIPKPTVYPLTTLEETIEACKKLNSNKTIAYEGFVVKDKYNKRIKIKNTFYLQLHKLKGEGVLTEKRALDLIRMNEQEELLTYYPEFKPIFDEMELKYKNFSSKLNDDLLKGVGKMSLKRKDYAEWATKQTMPSVLFALYDYKINTVEEGLEGLSSEKLLRYLK